ncbi:competence protein ComK [Planococcus sp. A6]|uniref:competence protein ComK n=1 Tax=Planococcus sp. A6 TaxID=2992760 RepID=UPI00237BF609|nr:competence protein ComK [Planococcus sp. A6]MDE0584618.1 competence protein ComK [Planococcus sp. A6]
MRKRKNFKLEMNIEKEIGQETVLILPDYDENGCLNSVIYHTDGMIKVESKPFDLIDTNLRFRGSSMRGAVEGSSAILGKLNKNPVIIDRDKGIILLPSKSAILDDCVWLSLQHIMECFSLEGNQTKVTLSNGSSIVLAGSKKSIQRRMEKAYELQFKMEAQKRIFDNGRVISENAYHLVKQAGQVNYEHQVE